MAVVGFMVGLFPSFFLERLTRQFQKQWFGDQKRAAELPLEMIEGLSTFTIFRLREHEIYNAQNLANINPVTIYVRTRYGLTDAIDWVSQAQLLVLFKFDTTEKLRDVSVRTILSFHNALVSDEPHATGDSSREPDEDLNIASVRIAEVINQPPRWIRTLVRGMDQDPSFVRLKELSDAIVYD